MTAADAVTTGLNGRCFRCALGVCTACARRRGESCNHECRVWRPFGEFEREEDGDE